MALLYTQGKGMYCMPFPFDAQIGKDMYCMPFPFDAQIGKGMYCMPFPFDAQIGKGMYCMPFPLMLRLYFSLLSTWEPHLFELQEMIKMF